MSFPIKLYKTLSEPNRLVKTLTDERQEEIVLKDITNISHPTILLKTDYDPGQYNYCYIAEFETYYFFRTKPTAVKDGIWSIDLDEDWIMTKKEQIVNLEGIITRQENDYNAYIVDGMAPVEADIVLDIYGPQRFTNPGKFTQKRNILLLSASAASE